MIDAGVEHALDEVLSQIRQIANGVDVGHPDAQIAARVVEQCAEAERLLAALRIMATATLQNKAIWRREGFRSAAAWMASKTGTPVGTAIATMEMANALSELPLLLEAFLNGRLSDAQARAIAEVASELPDAQAQLIEAADKLTLQGLREECRRVEAAGLADEDERHRRVRRARRVRCWRDRHGVSHLSAQGTPDDIARLMTEVERRCADTVADAVRGGWFESWEAHRFDALIDLARPDGGSPAPPSSVIHVMVDYEALMRGQTVTGETCEIPGFGPIPVTLARQMSEDAILKILLTKGVNVAAVAHGGYTIPAHLRTAVDARDEKCIVPACDMRRNLERDHRNSFGRTQVTKLEDLARLCRFHHYLKTFCGYTYRGGPGAWEWIPPEDLDTDLTPLRKIITSVRRC